MRFSVVVPVYQHWALIGALLDCLRQQSFPAAQVEVVLVDNGSRDFAPPRELPANVRVLRCDTPGSYAARNYGAQQARGEWLVFTDADCLPAPDWLEKLYDSTLSQDDERTLLAGSVETVSTSAKPSIYEIYDIVKGIPQARYVRRGYAATANLAVPRTVFERLGGFDGSRFSGGDAEFCRRAGADGCSMAYVSDARIDHRSRTTWTQIATKARRIKGGQLAVGAPSRRRVWLLGTLTPPLRGTWRFLTATPHPLHYRLIAVFVLFRVWIVGLQEAIRLGVGGRAERR